MINDFFLSNDFSKAQSKVELDVVYKTIKCLSFVSIVTHRCSQWLPRGDQAIARQRSQHQLPRSRWLYAASPRCQILDGKEE